MKMNFYENYISLINGCCLVGNRKASLKRMAKMLQQIATDQKKPIGLYSKDDQVVHKTYHDVTVELLEFIAKIAKQYKEKQERYLIADLNLPFKEIEYLEFLAISSRVLLPNDNDWLRKATYIKLAKKYKPNSCCAKCLSLYYDDFKNGQIAKRCSTKCRIIMHDHERDQERFLRRASEHSELTNENSYTEKGVGKHHVGTPRKRSH